MVVLTKIQKWGIAGISIILLLTFAYCAGRRTGSDNTKLSNNAAEIKKSDSVIKNAQVNVDTLKPKSDALVENRTVLRGKLRIVHDTVFTANPADVAKLIIADDSTIKAQSETIHGQSVAIEAYRVGISDRDDRIKILESMKIPKTMRGIQVGAGYCRNSIGGTPCVYIGYGLTLRAF